MELILTDVMPADNFTFHQLKPSLMEEKQNKTKKKKGMATTKGNAMQWRTEGRFGGGGSSPHPTPTPTPRNFKGPPKSCQTQPDCENC